MNVLLRFLSHARIVFAALLLVVSLAASPVTAQTFRGSIHGTTADPSGAYVAGASAFTTNSATGLEYATVSSSSGEFAFDDLPIGAYTVKIHKDGFADP